MKTLTFIICLGVVVAGCKKTSDTTPKTRALTESSASIIGINRLPCQNVECGGIEVTINGPEQSQNFLIYSSMSALGITDSTKFPINVELKWQPDTSPLRGPNYITVSDVQVLFN